MKYCVIDIGSNSVRLMTWADGTTLYKRLITTRLGEGLASSPVLSAAAIERTANAVAAFYTMAREEGAEPYAFATAAVRTAKNGAAFCARVKALCGLIVDVVSGEREAGLALSGALGSSDGSVIDIGGASTEVCARVGGKKTFSTSLDVGAVRLFDSCRDDPARLKTCIDSAVSPLRGVKLPQNTYAVGGTATTLAAVLQELPAYDAAKINDFPLTLREAKALAEKLLSLTAEERASLAGMDVRRADIIAGGACLLVGVMRAMGLERVYASDRDNLEGYLSEVLL